MVVHRTDLASVMSPGARFAGWIRLHWLWPLGDLIKKTKLLVGQKYVNWSLNDLFVEELFLSSNWILCNCRPCPLFLLAQR